MCRRPRGCRSRGGQGGAEGDAAERQNEKGKWEPERRVKCQGYLALPGELQGRLVNVLLLRGLVALRLMQPLAAPIDTHITLKDQKNEERSDLYCMYALFCGKNVNKYTVSLQSLPI